jgi:hypothetical protein
MRLQKSKQRTPARAVKEPQRNGLLIGFIFAFWSSVRLSFSESICRCSSRFRRCGTHRHFGLSSSLEKPDYNIPLVTMLSASCNRAAIVNIGVSTLNGFIGDHVGHEHSTLEVDGIGARRNAPGREFAAHAVITDTAGFPLARNEMQFLTPLAHDPVPHWHVVIMIRRGLVEVAPVRQVRTGRPDFG